MAILSYPAACCAANPTPDPTGVMKRTRFRPYLTPCVADLESDASSLYAAPQQGEGRKPWRRPADGAGARSGRRDPLCRLHSAKVLTAPGGLEPVANA